jgi:hypothetical protein
MKTTVRTKKDSQFKPATRKTAMGLRFCGYDNRGFFAMRSKSGMLENEEPLVVCEPWHKKANGEIIRVCYLGDNSEKWIESK